MTRNSPVCYDVIVTLPTLVVFYLLFPLYYLCTMKSKAINLHLPTCWAELTDSQLHLVFTLLARDISAAEVKTLCLCKWNGLKVLASLPGKRFITKMKGGSVVTLNARQIQQAISVLDFLDTFPHIPVRISKIGRHHAIAADFQQVPFEQYLYVDNLFQGYLHTQSDELLLQIAQVLYACENIKPDKAQLIGVFYWMASLKQFFAGLFSNFYKPVPSDVGNLLGNGQSDIYRQLSDSTNALIRALTGGDITKESAIMQMDTWRALTELDAKARESESLKRASKIKS